ncbi:MAG: RICIN domain-containing protein [Bacteroidota bacterium]
MKTNSLFTRMLRFGGLAILLLTCHCSAWAQQWSVEKANTWYASQPFLIGCNFIPSNSINQLEMWQAETFDPVTIDRELGWAHDNGYNTVRVFLHNLVWQQNAAGFKNRISQFLDICARHQIRPMLVFFDDCWNGNPRLGTQPNPVPGVHNSGWVQSPGHAQVTDANLFPTLEAYVKDILTTFANDNRILIWDLYNEPGNSGHGDATIPLLRNAFAWARQVNPSQPLTSAPYSGQGAINDVQNNNSDIISFHHYGPTGDTHNWIRDSKRFGRPVLCSEYMARTVNSSIQSHMPLFYNERVGSYNWGLVAGKTQTYFPWGSPVGAPEPSLWFHDVLRIDGSPYNASETNLLKQYASISIPKTDVIPTSAATGQPWKYTTTAPATNWNATSFSDGNWATGSGGFGSTGTIGATIRTNWTSADIWLRRTVTFPVLSADLRSSLALYIFHDEDAEVYFNGVLAATVPSYTTGYSLAAIRPEALNALVSGQPNVIAVHCRQQSGGQYIDLGIVALNDPIIVPPTETQSPYAGVIALQGVVEAENFDNGGESIAYHDTSPTNQIGPFRSNTAVDTEPCSEGGNNLAYSDNGEWLEYTVNVTATGAYKIDTRVSSPNNAGRFHIEFDGVNVTGALSVPNTGGWQAWQNVSKIVNLTAGEHIMRFVIDAKEFNTNKFTFTLQGGGNPDPFPTSGAVYRLVNRQSSQVLDVNACSLNNGMKVQQWPWNGGNCQRWKITATDNGYYKLTAQHSGQALEIGSASPANGAKANQWPSNECGCQQWKIEPTSGGFYKLTARHSTQVLEVGSALMTDGAAVNQWPWNNSFCQQWAIEPVAALARQGVEELPAVITLLLSPNPANDVVNVRWEGLGEEETVLTLVNAQGKTVHQQLVKTHEHLLATGALANGLYVVSLRSGHAVKTAKLLILH